MQHEFHKIIGADSGLIALRSSGGQVISSGPGVPPATIDAMTKALTMIMGPIAPHLLRRALLSARTPVELENACLEMIDSVTEREYFSALLAKRTSPQP